MYEELMFNPSQKGGHDDLSTQFDVETLRKDLEGELRLDSTDIRSYAWYHGRLPRDVAEQMVRNENEFLIRESISSTGEYVLTTRWSDVILHFKINKYNVQQDPMHTGFQYAFERESFDSIPGLIMHHVGKRIPISIQTGAVITTPVNRELPLSYSDVKYASLRKKAKPNDKPANAQTQFTSEHKSEPASFQPAAGFVLLHTKLPSSNKPTNLRLVSSSNEASSPTNLPQPFPLHLPVHENTSRNVNSKTPNVKPNKLGRETSSNNVEYSSAEVDADHVGPLPSIKHETTRNVPPKPSRVPSFRRPIIRHDSSQRKATNGKTNRKMSDQETKQRTDGTSRPSVTMRTSPRSVTSLLSRSEGSSMTSREMRRSSFNPCSYSSVLLPDQNKPVDGDVMKTIKSVLLAVDSFKLARHITFNDCEVCGIADSGLVDLFLARGKRFRNDLLERYQTFSFWVVVCILRGGTSKQDRVDILNVFIKIANELVHSLGDIYGFSIIMHGLMCPQLRGLEELWSALQQQYTNNAVTMKKKLLPLMRLLDEGKGQITKLSDKKQLSASEGNMLGSVASDKNGNARWWENLPDDSFDGLMAQLSLARNVLSWQAELRANAIGRFQDFEKKPIIHEMFSTEFHLRLLWGYKGAESPQKERYEKFDKLITLMANRSSA